MRVKLSFLGILKEGILEFPKLLCIAPAVLLFIMLVISKLAIGSKRSGFAPGKGRKPWFVDSLGTL